MKLKSLLKNVPYWQDLFIESENEKDFYPKSFTGRRNELGFMLNDDKMLNANVTQISAFGVNDQRILSIKVRY